MFWLGAAAFGLWWTRSKSAPVVAQQGPSSYMVDPSNPYNEYRHPACSVVAPALASGAGAYLGSVAGRPAPLYKPTDLVSRSGASIGS